MVAAEGPEGPRRPREPDGPVDRQRDPGPGSPGPQGAVDEHPDPDPGSSTLPLGGVAAAIGGAVGAPSGASPSAPLGDLCAVDPGAARAGASVDLDDWAVRRRRALWRAAGARAGGRAGRAGRAPAAVLLDMGGVVIPTLFESVAVAGFPGGPFRGEAEYAAVERGELAERDYWARLARAAARPGRGGAVAGLLAGAGRGPGGGGCAGRAGPAGGVHQRHGALVRA